MKKLKLWLIFSSFVFPFFISLGYGQDLYEGECMIYLPLKREGQTQNIYSFTETKEVPKKCSIKLIVDKPSLNLEQRNWKFNAEISFDRPYNSGILMTDKLVIAITEDFLRGRSKLRTLKVFTKNPSTGVTTDLFLLKSNARGIFPGNLNVEFAKDRNRLGELEDLEFQWKTIHESSVNDLDPSNPNHNLFAPPGSFIFVGKIIKFTGGSVKGGKRK